MTATASTYFLPGPNGEPPMFGPEGFAREETPHAPSGFAWRLAWIPPGNRLQDDPEYVWNKVGFTAVACEASVDSRSALALCEKAAQGWIRGREYLVTVLPDGSMQVKGREAKWGVVHPINGSPDWLAAARWVREEENKTKTLTDK